MSFLGIKSCTPTNSNSTLNFNSLESTSLSSSSGASHTYDEVREKHIYWSNIFTRKDDSYLVYIYSLTCSHCNAIKNDVIEFALTVNIPMYFITSSPEILIDQQLATKQNVNSLENLAIRGYPTLLYLVDHVVMINIAGEKGILDTLDTFKSH